MSKVLRLIGRTFHRDTVYEIRCANCGREYESTCSRKEAEALRYCNVCQPSHRSFLGVIRSDWPEFLGQDVRVVRVIPARAEAYVEVMCPEDGCEEAAS